MSMMEIEKLPTGIKQLDESLKGGVPTNQVILITGAAGTMKSSLAFQIAYNNVLLGKTALYISLEQSIPSILIQMSRMNFDLSKIRVDSNNPEVFDLLPKPTSKKQGMLKILDIGYVRQKQLQSGKKKGFSWLDEIKNQLKGYTSNKNTPDLVILDSLTALYHMDDFADKRVKLNHVFEYIRDLKTTSLVINEMQQSGNIFNSYTTESFLADGEFQLSLHPRNDYLIRKFLIRKMRWMAHDMTLFVLKFKSGKFTLNKDLEKENLDE